MNASTTTKPTAPATVAAPKSKNADQVDLSTVVSATLSPDVTDEQRAALALSGRASAMWQAYALTVEGKSVKDTAALLKRTQPTIRTHVWTVALALAMADVAHEETSEGLPPAEVATFLTAAVENVGHVQKVTKAEQPILALIEQAKATRVSQVKAVEADEALQAIPGAVASNVINSMKTITAARATDLKKAKDEAASKAKQEAAAVLAKAAQKGDETAEQRAARMARDERGTAVRSAFAVGSVDEVIGLLHIVVETLQTRKEKGHLEFTEPEQASGVAIDAHILAMIAGEDAVAMAQESAKATAALKDAGKPAPRRLPRPAPKK